MKKFILMLLLICGTNGYLTDCFVMSSKETNSVALEKPKQDSKELMYQDMLMLFLLPHIEKKIDEIYLNLLNYSPDIYPYLVNVKDVQRVNGFRGFHFLITLDIVPTVGPHIAVGEDILTFDISPSNPDYVRLISWQHIKDPQKSDFSPSWQDVVKE